MRKALQNLLLCLCVGLMSSCHHHEVMPSSNNDEHAKYIFYFISDGTGINSIEATEFFLSETNGKIGRSPLLMSTFPIISVASTYSYNSGVTDSAASGTALASGYKTYNGAIGVDSESVPVSSIAVWAKEAGMAVGIATSVCMNHATPAAFYAHSKSRSLYYDIASQLPLTNFDFFGGSDFLLDIYHEGHKHREVLYKQCADSGYVIARGSYADYEAKVAGGAEKIILFQDLDRTLRGDDSSLPYNIDAKEGELSVYDITKAEIDFLYQKSKENGHKGFFLMNEIGGKVDYACHANDAMTSFSEIMLVDKCLQLAFDFYKQHPNETLIILTSDHETGGFTIGNSYGHYATNLKALASQKCSVDQITRHLQALRSETQNRVSWEQVQECLKKDLGFWDTIDIDEENLALLKDIYTMSFVGKMPNENNLYSSNEPMAAAAMRIMQKIAYVGWTTGDHTGGLVPVYAIGVGSEEFAVHNDNAEIPLKIAKIAGFNVNL